MSSDRLVIAEAEVLSAKVFNREPAEWAVLLVAEAEGTSTATTGTVTEGASGVIGTVTFEKGMKVEGSDEIDLDAALLESLPDLMPTKVVRS